MTLKEVEVDNSGGMLTLSEENCEYHIRLENRNTGFHEEYPVNVRSYMEAKIKFNQLLKAIV